MDLRNQQIKETYGNLATINTVAGTPTTGVLQNGAGSNVTTLTIAGTLDATNVSATNLTGTLATAAQTNITSVGTLTGLGVSGTTGLDGAVTINESGADVDFRVEGDTDQNLLFVDASADAVGIGTTSIDSGFILETAGNIKSGANLSLGRSGTNYDGVGYNIGFTGTSSNWNYIISDTASLLSFDGGGFTFRGAPSGTAGNPITFTERMRIDSSETVVNDPQGDHDFRVEGDTDSHLIFADAGNDRVGIGTSSPAAKLDVNGAIKMASSTISSGIFSRGISSYYENLNLADDNIAIEIATGTYTYLTSIIEIVVTNTSGAIESAATIWFDVRETTVTSAIIGGINTTNFAVVNGKTGTDNKFNICLNGEDADSYIAIRNRMGGTRRVYINLRIISSR